MKNDIIKNFDKIDNLFQENLEELKNSSVKDLDKKGDIFDKALNIEDRYISMVKTTTELSNRAIENVRENFMIKHDEIVNDRYNHLNSCMESIEEEIEKIILKENRVLEKRIKIIKEKYYEEKDELIFEVIKSLKLDWA